MPPVWCLASRRAPLHDLEGVPGVTPSAENDAPTWVVHDMTHEHRLCANEKHEAEFGPMTEAQAQDMVRRGRPGAYWAQNLARNSVIPPVVTDDRETT